MTVTPEPTPIGEPVGDLRVPAEDIACRHAPVGVQHAAHVGRAASTAGQAPGCPGANVAIPSPRAASAMRVS